MTFFQQIKLVIGMLILLMLINRIVQVLIEFATKSIKNKLTKTFMISIKYLKSITEEKFIVYIFMLLEEKGYKNPVINDGDNHLICYKDSGGVFVYARSNNDDFKPITKIEVLSFLGKMKLLGMNSGIYATTGEFEKECFDIIELAKHSGIELILWNGAELVRELRIINEKKLIWG
ncbi:hypothetical protein CPJCM30710_02080 [Clostridium polyendosporum]|uniref:Restriction endonuclease type IV Mrr domain-containing protein n=1 Tax=Clostridium polyendosporum TaxID=69208 RepID=A0A919VEX0_9CLOT|nr:restriction endonuclease [Clostridium polyendosporum]GIM27542.1 hypothetical protein CPJCM30710_02080 [Clostridium polyendosporum]